MVTDAAEGCPVVDDFDPLSSEFLADPGRYLSAFHDTTPTFWSPGLAHYVFTRHADVTRTLREFNGAKPVPIPLNDETRPHISEEDFQIVLSVAQQQIVFTDPPDHIGQRRALQQTFTRPAVKTANADVYGIVNELIDEFAQRGECDLMTDFAYPLSLRVIGHMLGVPREDLPRLHQMANGLISLMVPPDAPPELLAARPDEEVIATYKGVLEGYRYFEAFVEERRANPTDDLASAMATLRDADGELVMANDTVIAHMMGLTAAGNDTTANLVGNIVRAMTMYPETREAAIADPALWESVVEETLRRYTPAPFSTRSVSEDTEIGGITLPAGAGVLHIQAAANVDPDVFPDPLRFDITRPNLHEHLAFGSGRHFCVGAPLARSEAQAAAAALYGRLPGLVADLDQPEEYLPMLAIRMRLHQRVTWDASETRVG